MLLRLSLVGDNGFFSFANLLSQDNYHRVNILRTKNSLYFCCIIYNYCVILYHEKRTN